MTAPDAHVLNAPPSWRRVDFLSDLHLQPSQRATLDAWQRFMLRPVGDGPDDGADAVFLLGDIFEVWVGDDTANAAGFERDCLQMLQAANRLRPVYLMVGNRDFLIGRELLAAHGVTLLPDPTVLQMAGQRVLLSHGDALCLDDVDYQRFRAQVRSDAWQQALLAKPLVERQAIGAAMRQQSEARKRELGIEQYADVDSPAATAWLHAANAHTLVHGHTHRPADHAMDGGLKRFVLSDWDVDATPPRAEVLRWTPQDASTPWQRLSMS